MILKDFLSNPVGKGDASVNASLITGSLDIKYNAVYNSGSDREKIEVQCFHQPNKDIYWIWFIIPSETGRGNSYDVVYKFSNPDPKVRTALSISKFDIQIFANSPSFAYTYAYVYAHNDLLIPELSSKLGSTFIKKSPDTRNRNQNILFDKYVYFGAKHIMTLKLLNRTVIDIKSKKFDVKYLTSNVRSLTKIMDDYHIAEEKQRQKKIPSKKKENTKKSNSGSTGVKVIPKQSSVRSITKNAAKKPVVKKTNGTIKKK